MNREDVLARITIDPNVCFGKPCIRGHRIWVSLILDFLASGWSTSEILENYPGLEEADIRACIAYGANIEASKDPSAIGQYGLTPGQYYLIASRLVPENNDNHVHEYHIIDEHNTKWHRGKVLYLNSY